MNNASVLDYEQPEPEKDSKPILRERLEKVVKILEALQNIESSGYWQVLKQNVFEVDLNGAKSRLATEKDTTEMFRLQGKISGHGDYDLLKRIAKYRDELKRLKENLNG